MSNYGPEQFMKEPAGVRQELTMLRSLFEKLEKYVEHVGYNETPERIVFPNDPYAIGQLMWDIRNHYYLNKATDRDQCDAFHSHICKALDCELPLELAIKETTLGMSEHIEKVSNCEFARRTVCTGGC